jgi:hypothetical protein
VCLVLAAGLHHGVEEPARRRLVRLWGGRRAVETVPAAVWSQSPTGATPTGDATARRLTPPLTASGRPWPLTAPPQSRTEASHGLPADAVLAAGDGRGPRPRG